MFVKIKKDLYFQICLNLNFFAIFRLIFSPRTNFNLKKSLFPWFYLTTRTWEFSGLNHRIQNKKLHHRHFFLVNLNVNNIFFLLCLMKSSRFPYKINFLKKNSVLPVFSLKIFIYISFFSIFILLLFILSFFYIFGSIFRNTKLGFAFCEFIFDENNVMFHTI